MRRRRPLGRELTAAELVEQGRRIRAGLRDSGVPDIPSGRALRSQLALIGYDAVQLTRAAYWLRRGRPDGYRWEGDFR